MNFKKLKNDFNYGLRNFPDVTTYSDIFEHILLRLIGYSETPEKCQFDPLNESNFSISLRAPYGIPNTQFVKDLQKQLKALPIIFEEIEPDSAAGNFIVKLIVPYSYIESKRMELFKAIEMLLNNPEKREIYSYWSASAKEYYEQNGCLDDTPFIMWSIESQIDYLSFSNPLPVWNEIVKALAKDDKLELLTKRLQLDKDGYQIEFVCKSGASDKTITVSLNKIVELIKNSGLKKFLTSFEFIGFPGARQIPRDRLQRHFKHNAEGDNYRIELGYHSEVREMLEKMGVSALSSSLVGGDAERGRYYVYDKQNYFKATLALAEMFGRNCSEERFHQLMYYCHKEKWNELKEHLNFLMEFSSRTVNIDYTDLLFKSFDYAKENEIHGSLSIIHDALVNLVNSTDNKEVREKTHKILFEIGLWEMAQFEREGGSPEKKQELAIKLFEHSFEAGLPEATRYHMVASGFNGMEEPVCLNLREPMHVLLVECGQKICEQSEQLAAKDKEIAALKEQLAKAQAKLQQQASSVSRGPAFFQAQPQQRVAEVQEGFAVASTLKRS